MTTTIARRFAVLTDPPVVHDPGSASLVLARQIEAAFQQANDAAIMATHAQGRAAPILEDSGPIAWLQPDGMIRHGKP